MNPLLREFLDLVSGLVEGPENWLVVRRLQELRRVLERELGAVS